MAVQISVDLEYEPRDRKTIASSGRKNPGLMTDDVELLKVGKPVVTVAFACGGYEKCELRGPVAFGP